MYKSLGHLHSHVGAIRPLQFSVALKIVGAAGAEVRYIYTFS